MKFDALTEWRKFKDGLIQEIQTTSPDDFKSAWSGLDGRTQFYANKLLPKVAERLGQDHRLEREHLRLDYVILNSDSVPVIFIESENHHPSASHEIEKLCAASSPVKVLMLCCSWADGERNKYLPDWLNRIATHHKYNDLNSIYMIVVVEMGRGNPSDGILRCYIESFDNSGTEIEPSTVLELSKPWEIE